MHRFLHYHFCINKLNQKKIINCIYIVHDERNFGIAFFPCNKYILTNSDTNKTIEKEKGKKKRFKIVF